MTHPIPKSEYKRNQPKDLIGTHEKKCLGCDKMIVRNGMNNMRWVRKTFCSTPCRYAALNHASWTRKRTA